MTSKELLQEIKKDYNWETADTEIDAYFQDYFKQIERDLEVLECFKKYFHFELVFEKNQTFLIFKSKERYLPVDDKLSVSNKYYEPLKEWLENL